MYEKTIRKEEVGKNQFKVSGKNSMKK
jgi:hypothetical protein